MRVFSDKKIAKTFKTISGRDVTWIADCFCPGNKLSERVAAEYADGSQNILFADVEPDHWRAGADASFIAAANPATVLELLDELDRLRTIEAAARNLVKAKGRHHSEQARNQLLEALG